MQRLLSFAACVGTLVSGQVLGTCDATKELYRSQACCGNGHCDGAESAASCPADCHEPAPVLVQSQVGSAQNGFVSEASLAWTPTRGDEGRAVLLCVEAADQTFGTAVVDPTRGASGTGPSLCVTFAVARCAYCVPEGATLRNVARHYMLNLDWLRLYNSNPETPDPDKLAPLQRIRVGPTYSAKEGDSLVTIAASMRTTVKASARMPRARPPCCLHARDSAWHAWRPR